MKLMFTALGLFLLTVVQAQEITRFEKGKLGIQEPKRSVPGTGMPNFDFFGRYYRTPSFIENEEKTIGYVWEDKVTLIKGSQFEGNIALKDINITGQDRIAPDWVPYYDLPLAPSFGFGRLQMENGDIWVPTNRGLFYCNGESWRKFGKHTPGLLENSLGAIAKDKNGIIWAKGLKGIAKYENNRWITFRNKKELPGRAKQMFIGPKGNLWVIFQKKGVAEQVDGKWKFHSILEAKQASLDGLGNIIFFSGGKLFDFNGRTATAFDGENFIPLTTQVNSAISMVRKDKKGHVWVAKGASELAYFKDGAWQNVDLGPMPAEARIYDMVEKGDGTIYFVSNKGVHEFSNGKLIHHFLNTEERSTAFEIYEDKNGNTWLYSAKRVFQFKGEKVTDHTQLMGLKEEFDALFVNRVIRTYNVEFNEDAGGRLWCIIYYLYNTNTSAVVVDIQTTGEWGMFGYYEEGSGWKLLSKKDEFKDTDCAIMKYFEDSQGDIWLDSPDMIYRIKMD